MSIKDKIYMEREQLEENGAITIVAFGDSVTHGALAADEIDYDTVYWNRLRKKILEIRDYVPVNVINSAIGGTTAIESVKRIDKQVLAYSPDLTIICFGLNDVGWPLEDYLEALKIMFEKCSEGGGDVIFMTPNMLNTYVADDTEDIYLSYAATTAEWQNNGRMDLYMESAVALARDMNIKVCDCYSKWKDLSKTQDTTMLLANRINHPAREMHELFAESLFEMIFDDFEVLEKDKNFMVER